MQIKKKRRLVVSSMKHFLFLLCFSTILYCLYNLNMEVCASQKTAIILSTSKKNMVVGESFILHANIPKRIANNRKIQWKSSRSSVASVSQKGSVKAKKKGTAKITVTIKGTNHKATCIINVTDIFNESKFTADLNGDGKLQNIKIADIRTGSDAYVSLTAYLDENNTETKKYSGYYSSTCVIGDLSGNGADDILLLNYETSSVHGEMEIHILHFKDGKWTEYPDKLIQNPSIAEKQPDYFYGNSMNDTKNAWVGATILKKDGRNYLRCILLDQEDPEFDTVTCIDVSYQQDGWYIENVQIIENYYSEKREKEILAACTADPATGASLYVDPIFANYNSFLPRYSKS